MSFVPRFTIPDKGNPYYNTKKNGGYSDAIQGKPVETGLDVLRNCVGYAYGRFNEIVGAGYMKYLAPVNAEQFIDCMNYKTKGVTSGMTPKLGACMVWQAGATKKGSDGAGHVAIVEQINADGSIITSESGYAAKQAFWTQTRTNANGRWGQNSNYKFLGFIYNPAVDDTPVPTPTPGTFSVDEIVNFLGGNHHTSSNDKGTGTYKAPSLARITAISEGAKYPYHCRKVDDKGKFVGGGVYGWVAANTVSKIDSDKSAIEAEIKDIDTAIADINKKIADLNTQLVTLQNHKAELEAQL